MKARPGRFIQLFYNCAIVPQLSECWYVEFCSGYASEMSDSSPLAPKLSIIVGVNRHSI